ncbi:Transferase family [Musa troglodytarum]|uniref:Transferase family n=1 Tax=Musa troglodytarum TaxID=320322 RepID=A0A9E7KGV9_9LILI|nr:Transferase family [Musa troglodytarum]
MEVEIVESSFVVPSEDTPKHSIWLSNLDLMLAPRSHTPTITLFRYNGDRNFFSVEVLKAALAKALLHFYPLAGRVAVGEDGRLEIQCTGEGVLFVVARSTCTLDVLSDFTPSEEMRQLFAPSSDGNDSMCIMLQVTFFECGGVCLGIATHHGVMDGVSALHFINTWSDIARGAEGTVVVSLDRALLRARSPPTVPFEHFEYQCYSPRRQLSTTMTAKLMLSKDQLTSLKTSIELGSRRRVSTFEAVTAYVWRCACKARQLEADQETRLYMAVDVRSRLKPPLSPGYFGNAVVRTSVAVATGEIVSSPLQRTVEQMHDAVVRLDDEYIRSIIDLLELMKDIGEMDLGSWQESQTDLWAVSWLRLPVYEADFGWGKPAFMARAHVNRKGMLYLLRSPEGDGGITLMLTLEPENMPRFMKVFIQELDCLKQAGA